MTEPLNVCIEPDIYPPGDASFAERRAITIGKYLEEELEEALENRIREHLARCGCCSEFVNELQDVEEVLADTATVIHARCPSDVDLERYVSGALPAAMQGAIGRHLTECPLCKEETNWLKELGAQQEVDKPVVFLQRRNWVQYGAIAAALFFMALSLFLWSQRASITSTEERLRAAAVVKTPQEIDFVSLKKSSVSLPEKMAGVYEQGAEAVRRESYEEAIRHLEIVATSQPNHSGALYLLGYSYYHMQDHERAFELCDRAERMGPHSLERCLSLVHIALKTGHYRRAIEEISGLHHAAPEHPEVKATYERIRSITGGRPVRL